MGLANINTTVVNTSGQRMYFDFLPPLGMYLDPDEEFEHIGDVDSWLRRKGCGPVREKMVAALNYALDNHLIEIKNGPASILYDETLEESRELSVDDGDVIAVLPASVPTTTPAPTTTAP